MYRESTTSCQYSQRIVEALSMLVRSEKKKTFSNKWSWLTESLKGKYTSQLILLGNMLARVIKEG
jgi:hypothetical protein